MRNMKKITQRYIIIKFLQTNNKDKCSEKKKLYKREKIKMTDFLFKKAN